MAVDTLTERDRAVLDLEAQRFDTPGGKEQAIRNQLDITPVRYYQRLNQLLDTEAALAAHPMMVNRLRRLRDARRRRSAAAL